MKNAAALPQSPTLTSEPLTRAGAFFMLLPVLLLGVGVFGWIWMIRLAVDDPSAAIEPDYYAQASHIDAKKALMAQSEALRGRSECAWSTVRELLSKDLRSRRPPSPTCGLVTARSSRSRRTTRESMRAA
jgi:hypothetical protein